MPLYILHAHEKHAEKHQLLYTYTYEVQLHLRGIAAPMAKATPMRYSYLIGSVSDPHPFFPDPGSGFMP
jgi:hypothetical protein